MVSIKYVILIFLLFALTSFTSQGQSKKAIETSTDIFIFINPVTGFVTTLVIGDYKGSKQIVLVGATNIAVTYALKYSIKKERPDHSNQHAFPSNHTSISFQGAAFIQKRYGWKWGIPAYLLSGYVGWGRTYCKQHDWWDVLAGAVIGTASSYLFTRPYAKKYHFTLSPAIVHQRHPGFYVSISL